MFEVLKKANISADYKKHVLSGTFINDLPSTCTVKQWT